MVSRRDVLKGLGAAGSVGVLGGAGVGLAAAPTDQRLVVVVLRGGLDGLGVVPPYGDPEYRRTRPNIAIAPPGGEDGALDLDGRFGLHPTLKPLQELYRQRELLVVHAVGTPFRSRSHFDAQDVLENGTLRPRGRPDGWLNRALATINGGDQRIGLAVGHTVPLLMRGPVPVRTWAPNILPTADAAFLDRLARMYASDKQFAATLRAARKSATGAAQALGPTQRGSRGMRGTRGRGGYGRQAFKVMAGAAGKLMRAPDGPRIASLELGGWDTHINQSFALKRPLGQLADGLMALKTDLGSAWRNTVVVVVSEFGRTVAENGGRGTDHGSAGLAFLLGGAVAGGRVAGRWPGLAPDARLEGRDLKPTTDLRRVLKGVLRDHLGLQTAALDSAVFPDSAAVQPLAGLVRSV